MLQIQKDLSRNFYVLLSLPATAMGFALCIQIAALSWILNTKYGLNLEEVGFVWAAGPLAGILGQPIVGLISDKVWFWGGRRRPFILIGGTIAALMILALPNIHIIDQALGIDYLIGVALTVALTLDLAINVSFNPTRSIIADVTPLGEERTRGFAWMQTISGFFGVLAYLIGAFYSNYTLIYIGAVLVFVFSVFPTLFIKEKKELDDDEPRDKTLLDEPIIAEVASNKTNWNEFLKINLAHAFTWLGVQTMFVYTFFYIKVVIMGYGPEEELAQSISDNIGFIIGIAFAVLNTVGFLLPAPVLEPLAQKFGRVRTHMSCIAIMAMGYLLLVLFGQSKEMLFVLMAVVGIGWAAVVSLPFAIMSEVVDQSRMGFFMGLFNLSVVLPQLVASGLGGYIQGFEDKSIIFIISAVSLGISAVLWFFVKESKSETKPIMSGGGH